MKYQKFCCLFLGLITVALLSSCGDDEKESASVSLVGTWQVQSRELFDCSNANLNGVLECSSNSTSTDCGTWEFKTDGNYIVRYDGGSFTQQYEVNQNGTMEFCYTSTCYPFYYALSGSTLTITEARVSAGSCLHKYIMVKI